MLHQSQNCGVGEGALGFETNQTFPSHPSFPSHLSFLPFPPFFPPSHLSSPPIPPSFPPPSGTPCPSTHPHSRTKHTQSMLICNITRCAGLCLASESHIIQPFLHRNRATEDSSTSVSDVYRHVIVTSTGKVKNLAKKYTHVWHRIQSFKKSLVIRGKENTKLIPGVTKV